MSVLTPSPVSTDRFYRTNTFEFCCDLSDLGKGFRLERVYDDACDVGLTLVSAKTGREIVMVVEHEERDREGELQWLDLLPAKLSERGTGITVRLYND